MKTFLLTAALLLHAPLHAPLRAQVPAVDLARQTQTELSTAITGQWTGVLEYRDYSEPATSTRRVKLPTWLTMTPGPAGALKLYFLYDDGPNKVVDESLTYTLDVPGATLTITNDHNRSELYKVSGYDTLRSGRGELTLLGPGTDNGRPAETRIVLTLRRNLLAWTEETRPTSAVPFAFRHSYTFTRAPAPAPALNLTPAK